MYDSGDLSNRISIVASIHFDRLNVYLLQWTKKNENTETILKRISITKAFWNT